MSRDICVDRFFIPTLLILVFLSAISLVFVGTNSSQVKILVDIMIAIVTGAFIATISIKYTFGQTRKLDYYEYMNGVLSEINENTTKLSQFSAQVDKLKREWGSLKETWIQDKTVAIWPRSNRFFYQYLSDNQFNVLKNSGYFRKLKSPYLNLLGLFYLNCLKFNDETQTIEDEIDDIRIHLIQHLKEVDLNDPHNISYILRNTTIKKAIDEPKNKKQIHLKFKDSEYPALSLELRARRGYEKVAYLEYIPLEVFFDNAIQELKRLHCSYGENIRQNYSEIIQGKKSNLEIISTISLPEMSLRSFGINFY